MLALSKFSAAELALMTRVARAYYIDGQKQPQIAERLGVSQSKVSRLLTAAVEAGIVRISVVGPERDYPELEQQLREKFGLRDAVIAHSADDSEQSVLSAIGAAGAIYLEGTLQTDDVIGLSSWSSTLLAVVDSMRNSSAKTSKVVQLLGGVGNPTAQISATRLTDELARVTSAEPMYLAAPGVVASREVRDGLLRDQYISQVVEAWSKVSVALVGIGALQPSPMLEQSGNTVGDAELTSLRNAAAVGDVCLHFFDADGSAVVSSFENRLIGIPAEVLRGVGRRIGFAGGSRKLEAVRAALLGNWVDVLVTDQRTALALVSA